MYVSTYTKGTHGIVHEKYETHLKNLPRVLKVNFLHVDAVGELEDNKLIFPRHSMSSVSFRDKNT